MPTNDRPCSDTSRNNWKFNVYSFQKSKENGMTKVKVEDRESGGREVGCTCDIGDKHG